MKSLKAILVLTLLLGVSSGFAQDEDDFESEMQQSMEEVDTGTDLPPSEFGSEAFGDESGESFTAPEEQRPFAPTPAYTPPPVEMAAPGTFQKPKGPPQGGTLETTHPNAAKGLLRIEKDGTYVYRTHIPEKSRSSSMRVGYLTTPLIRNNQGVSFGDIYGADGLLGLVGEYEWQPFRRFGALGFRVGSGLVVARGNGRFADGVAAEEIYNLIVLPLSAEISYRFEYVRRQWAVPFVTGGAIGYGMVEFRDDGKTPTMAFSPAVVAGGGIHFNISRWDPQGAFILAQDYAIADLWLTLEGKVIQGLDQGLDMTNQTVSAGFTVDF